MTHPIDMDHQPNDENDYKSFPLTRRKGEKLLDHFAIQRIAISSSHLQAPSLQLPMARFEFLSGDLLAGVHGFHAAIHFGAKLFLTLLLHLSEERCELKSLFC
jgi:hypothetical protein